MMCIACSDENHYQCGMQTWCECDCDGSPDWGAYNPDPYDDAYRNELYRSDYADSDI